jgi:hypothetical protein
MATAQKCINCAKPVEYNGTDPEFSGFGPCPKKPGKHEVEAATFYHPGARDIQDQRDRRKFAPVIILQPSYERSDAKTGAITRTRGVSVQFYDGKLETCDPEVQFYLRQKPDIAEGEEGLKMWRAIYLTPDQNLKIAQSELADTERKIQENKDLLARVKENQKDGKLVSA